MPNSLLKPPKDTVFSNPPDTFHKGTAYLFEQVSAEDIVEYSGYRIEKWCLSMMR